MHKIYTTTRFLFPILFLFGVIHAQYTLSFVSSIDKPSAILNTAIDQPGTISDIEGVLRVGETLTAGTITDPDGEVSNQTYQWQVADTSDGTFTPISGATSATYYITNAEFDRHLNVVVTYTDPTGDGNTVTSAVTGRIGTASPLEVTWIDDDQRDVFASGFDPSVDGRYRRISDTSGLTFSSDFDPNSNDPAVIDTRRSVYCYNNGVDTWYIWGRGDLDFHISRTEVDDKWFKERQTSFASFFTQYPVDVEIWEVATAPAGETSLTLVETAEVTDYVTSEKVTYTIHFNHEVNVFELNDIVILDASDTDITAAWTVEALTKDPNEPEDWTVDVTPPPGMDATEIRLQILGGRVTANVGGDTHTLEEYTQQRSTQTFDTSTLDVSQPTVVQISFNNPVGESLQITSEQRIEQVRIFSIAGHIVFEQSLQTINPRIDVAQLAAGVYILEIDTKTTRKRVKLIKE